MREIDRDRHGLEYEGRTAADLIRLWPIHVSQT
jgi:hypothetical protein